MSYAFGPQPFAQIAVDGDQMIVGSARDPQEFNLSISFRVERGKIFFKIVGDAAGAERADPGKLVEMI